MTTRSKKCFPTSFYPLIGQFSQGQIIRLDWHLSGDLPADHLEVQDEEIASNLADWLVCYQHHDRRPFTGPLALTIKDNAKPLSQCRVWSALATIPYGKRISYKELAQRLGVSHPSHHCRSVGQGCRTNPFSLILPCHRITNSNGGLGGYGGKITGRSIALKQALLTHEADTGL